MITASAFFVFFGFFTAYHSSAKVVRIEDSYVESLIQGNAGVWKILSVVFLALSLFIAIVNFGAGVGTLAFFIALMVSGSLIVLLVPMRLLSASSAVIVFLIFSVTEILTLT